MRVMSTTTTRRLALKTKRQNKKYTKKHKLTHEIYDEINFDKKKIKQKPHIVQC